MLVIRKLHGALTQPGKSTVMRSRCLLLNADLNVHHTFALSLVMRKWTVANNIELIECVVSFYDRMAMLSEGSYGSQ